MGNSSSLMLQEDEIQAISAETGFSRNQIVRLYSRFLSLDKQGRGYLDRDDFLRIPELAINPLGDRIVDAFFTETEDLGQKINFREFIRVLAHFRPISKEKRNILNSREEKLKFAFSMYDLNKNGFITRDEFKVILNMMVGANITAEQLESIADRTISEADIDNDGKISFDEFCRAMEKTDIEQKMSIRFLN
ncbi:calcium-binding protein, putative [Brugia malayi]|uniref:Bm7565 n=4 Tax=Filarioidea TaxID=6295 RepID=A0A0K0JSX1_BRUMA|nr:calcium-binding protein, putative [Brugia malayi]CRZ24032.1 Bm7565 [Brugia malayi]VIO99189.1 calcium-binding protein, putative [Brugia malayi]